MFSALGALLLGHVLCEKLILSNASMQPNNLIGKLHI